MSSERMGRKRFGWKEAKCSVRRRRREAPDDIVEEEGRMEGDGQGVHYILR